MPKHPVLEVSANALKYIYNIIRLNSHFYRFRQFPV